MRCPACNVVPALLVCSVNHDGVLSVGRTRGHGGETQPEERSHIVIALYFPSPDLRALTVVLAAMLASCTAPARPAPDNAAVQAEVASEVRRICSLPEDQREVEIRRIKDQSGVVIDCGER